ncbi:MAG: 2-dehydropantoate 2-reductase [Gemmatimonadota bacterium]|nr:2-dehydropantoate 2-reductase [Gemmatimonadota bacterium]
MRILILGAGALGGLVGAQLARAGEDVTLLEVNAARARLLSEDGVLISRIGEPEACVPLRVVSSVEGQGPFDLVFVAVKSYETADAVRTALPACTGRTLFLSLQNGIGNAEAMATLVDPSRILCGITYHSIQHTGPRRLQYRTGIKPIQIAPFAGRRTPALEAIGAMFRKAGLDTEVVPDVEHAIWQKLLHNAVVNPTSALTGLTCREMLADDDLMAFMRSLCDEIVAVMRARDVPIVNPDDPFKPIVGSLTALGKNRPSMWQDLMRGKRTEVDALNGAVVKVAEAMGLAAPHNAAITHFIHSRERNKFLNRERIAYELGIVEHRPVEAAAPAFAAPAVHAGGGPRPGQAPRLESTRKLKELVGAYYTDLRAAGERGQLVAACSTLAPVEILRALDIAPYFPEHHAVVISAKHQSSRYLARAGAEGFSQFASSGMRVDIGALLQRTSPFSAAYGIEGPPRPDLAVFCTNSSHEFRRWFEFYGGHFDVPVAGFSPPPAAEANGSSAGVDLVRHLIERLEGETGRRLDVARLSEIVGLSAEAAGLWSRILDLAQATPAPFTFFDSLVHVAPIALLRGTSEAVSYYRLLADELEQRVRDGVGALEHEQYRFYWDGPPVWCAMRALSGMFATRGVAIVASTYASTFALSGLDANDPVASTAAAYANVFGNRSDAVNEAWLASRFSTYGVDAVVYHDCRTSPEAGHVRYGVPMRVERRSGVPGYVLEADAHDPRLFSAERLERQLDEFIERHRELQADRFVAV